MDVRVVRRIATGMGLGNGRLRPLGGATASVWAVGDQVLRIGPRSSIDKELAASAAAAAAVPVPRVLDRFDVDASSGVLLELVRGRPAGDLTGCTEETARVRGRRCGALHAVLAAVPAPTGVPTVVGPYRANDQVSVRSTDQVSVRSADALLHLDLHPLNVLVDADHEVTAVVDWANAAAGPAALDRARTAAILTTDPTARARRADPRWRALVAGWSEAAGWTDLPAWSRRWALRFTLDDLSGRHPPAELAPLTRALAELADVG